MPSRDDASVGDGGTSRDGKAALASVIKSFAGDDLRDIWVLDERVEESLYLRSDIESNIEEVDVERYMDNERFGFVTRATYNQLHYSEFGYTLRGFDTWELFRTFFVEDAAKVGVLCSVDRRPGGYDYANLNDEIQELLTEYDISDFAPDVD